MKKFTLLSFMALLCLFVFQFSAGAQTVALAVQNGDTGQLMQLINSGANINQAIATTLQNETPGNSGINQDASILALAIAL